MRQHLEAYQKAVNTHNTINKKLESVELEIEEFKESFKPLQARHKKVLDEVQEARKEFQLAQDMLHTEIMNQVWAE